MSKNKSSKQGQQSKPTPLATLLATETTLSQTIIENHPDFIGVGSLDGKALYVNPAGLRMIGLSEAQDVIGMDAFDFYPEEDAKRLVETGIPQAMETGKWTAEVRLLRKDGSTIPVEQTVNINFDVDQKPLNFSITMRDISVRKQQVEQLRLSSRAIEYSNNPIVVADAQHPDMPLIYVNEAFERVTGYATEDVLGKNCRFLQGNDTDQPGLEALRQAIQAKEPCDVVLRNYRKDGTLFWNRLRLSPIFDADGQMTHIVGLQSDITELRTNREDLRQMLESSPEAIGLVNTETGLFESVNSAAEKLYGLPREELVTVGPGQMSPEFQEDGRSSFEAAGEKIGEALSGGRPVFEWMHKNAQGDLIPCEVRLVGLPAERKHLVRFSVTDISDRIRQRDALRTVQDDLSLILDTSPDAIGLVNTKTGLFESVNKAAEKMYGLPREELITFGPGHFAPDTLPDGRVPSEVAAEQIAKALAGEASEFEYVLKSRQGELIPCEIRLVALPGERGHLVRFSITDISERKKNEALLLDNQKKLEKMANELQIIAEIATEISEIIDESELLQSIADITKERFGLYHTQFYMLDKAGKTLKLAAGSGRVGNKLLNRGHQLLLAQPQSIVAQAGREKKGVRVNDVQSNPNHLPNPLLPRTKAEMAVPMLYAGRLLGVLDVQSKEADSFSEDDVRVMITLAEQMAVAVQNARRFAQTQKLLEEQEQLTNALASERNVLQIIMDTLPGYIYAKDSQSRFLWANMATAHAMGVEDPKDLLGKTDLDFYPPELGEKFYEDEQTLFASGQSLLNIEERLVDQTSQDETWISTSKVLMRDDNQQVSGMVGIGLDITDRKLASQRIERQAQIIQNAKIMIGATTPEGNALFMNRAGLDIFGYEQMDDVVGRHILDFHPSAERERFENEILPTLFAEDSWRGETEFLTKDGRKIPIEQFMFLIRDEAGAVQLIGTSATDISERKRAEANLRERETLLQTVIDSSPDWVFIKDREHRYRLVNKAYSDSLQIPVEAFIGKNDLELGFPEDIVKGNEEKGIRGFWPDDTEVMTTGKLKVIDVEPAVLDGEEAFLRTVKVPLQNLDDEVWGVLGFVQIITEQIQSQNVIKEREALLQTVIDSSPDWVFIKDRDHRYRLVNKAYSDSLQIPVEAFIGKNDLELGFPEDIVKGNEEKGIRGFWPDDTEVMTTGKLKVIDVEPAVLDGEEAFLRTVKVPLRNLDDEVWGVLGFVQIITEQIQSRNVIQERETLLQTIIDSLPSWIFVKDKAHRYQLVNKAFIDSMEGPDGRSAEDYIGKHDLELELPEPVVLGDEAHGIKGIWFEEDLVFESGETMIHEVEETTFGGEAGFIRTVRIPLINEKGETTGVLSSIQDITPQIEAQKALEQAKADLENRVLERTAELEHSRGQIQKQFEDSIAQAEILRKRAAELEIVTQVTEAAATSGNSEQLLTGVMDLIKQSFNLYHAHVYEMNEAETAVVLTYGSGEAGQKMRTQGRSIEVGNALSLVARAVRTREGVIENDLQAAPGYLANPLLPHSRSSLAIPMLVDDSVIGVFNVQSDKTNHFAEEDVRIQTTIANQISLALQNAKSFAQSERALRELNSLTQQLTRQGWERFDVNAERKHAYRYDLHAIHEVDELAVEQEELHVQPISVRGATIGELGLKLPESADDEASIIIEAVAARLGEHLETLRLTEQTQVALAETAQQADKLAELNELGKELNNAQNINDLYASVARNISSILDVDRMSLALLTPNQGMFELFALEGVAGALSLNSKLPIDGTAVGAAVRKQRLISTSDASQSKYMDHEILVKSGLYSMLCFPLITSSGTLGTLNVGAKAKNAFTENDENLMSQIAALLTASIENQTLLAKAEAKAERERRVRAITDKIRQRSTRESILETARDEIGALLQAKDTSVHLGDQGSLIRRLKPQQPVQEDSLVENQPSQGD